MDQQVFDEEQRHLTETYGKLSRIDKEVRQRLTARVKEAREGNRDMQDELAVDFSGDVNVETFVEYEALNKMIDDYNLANEMDSETLRKTQVLLRQPYFAKISLQFRPGAEPRDLYIGTTGITDENMRHFIIDWRSPVAEVYYNQSTGKTSYQVDGRTITADLKLRRQFDLDADKLNAYFDTTIAIEDPLLLASLAQSKSDTLRDITATIQKEQNAVIRHEDVPVLLVNGIAGSGKTSVLLQRIAYLFYKQRETLKPTEVYLITPNLVFQRYIAEVLPDMGESNPNTLTWDALMDKLGMQNHGLGKDASADTLHQIDELLEGLKLEQADFQDIRIDDERVITANAAFSAWQRYKRFPAGIHRSTLVMEDLHDKLEARIVGHAADEDVQDEISELDEETMVQAFGGVVVPSDEKELREYARQYLVWRYRDVHSMIEDGAWLRFDRIGMRMLGKQHLTSAEYLYLKLSLAGGMCRDAKYVMIDEVQDYTQPQLMVLSKYFNNAHFLLLGDPNQAIKPGTATFGQVRDIFKRAHGDVNEVKLMTSYRSSPEITNLFTKLMSEAERVNATSVQRPGVEPIMLECDSDESYADAVRNVVREALNEVEGITAIVTADYAAASKIEEMLDDELNDHVMRMDGKRTLPESGVILLDVALAKGLEFNRVIVPDAQNRKYEDEALTRRRLYTAISRATNKVTLLSNGPMTHLLA